MSKDKDPSDDNLDFSQLMSDVTPLQQDKVSPPQRRRKPVPLQLKVGEPEDELVDLNIETGEELAFQRPGVQNRVFHDLKRGYIEAEATLDLHGMRVVDARQAMSRFLNQSGKKGRRCVLVIHGKGQGSKDQQPVLKQKTNQWLRQRDEVLAFCSAPRWNGGAGATYVLLSRKHANRP